MRWLLVVALPLWVLSYLALRFAWSEAWNRDQQVYMIFPAGLEVLYYLYRPLSYADGALTGMRFHIGPHQ